MTIPTCPECGATMRRQHSKTPRYVCPRNEQRRDENRQDGVHAYLRSWTEDELDQRGCPDCGSGHDIQACPAIREELMR